MGFKMKLPGLKSRVSFGLPGFAGLPTLRSGRHSSPGLKAWGFLAGLINIYAKEITPRLNCGVVPSTKGKIGMRIRLLIEGILLSVIGIVSFIEGLRLILYKDPVILYDALGPGDYILILGLVLIGVAVVHVIVNYRKPIMGKVQTVSKEMRTRMISIVVVIMIYTFLIDIVGYLGATIFFFLTEFRVIGIKSWRLNIILSIVLTGVYYIVFVQYGDMVFPRGILFR